MPAYQLLRQEEQEDEIQLKAQLEAELAECTEAKQTYRNKVKAFMEAQGIWHISELDYPLREAFHGFLEGQISPVSYNLYMKAFDQIKQHSLKNQFREIKDKKLKYENKLFFLFYHPDQILVSRFKKAQKLSDFIWDFQVQAPEKMKRQIFHILNYLVETLQNDKYLRYQMNALRTFYQFCIEQKVDDIEMLELSQIQDFRNKIEQERKEQKVAGIVDTARKILFLEAKEIRWAAHVWYLDRFYFQPDRILPSIPVKSLSFLEVAHKQNRELLKEYMRYGLGVTNLKINNLQLEFLHIRNFLSKLVLEDGEDVCSINEQQMDTYFRNLQEKEIQADTYNKIVMCIVHFFNFLQVHQYINRIPFCTEYYLKKVIQKHHDRSVEFDTAREILQNLYLFPEETRLMYLHLWAVGLRISEVCTLKGNAYYKQGKDTWIQVYQIKAKNYKRIPIPDALYQLMMVYLKKHGIEAEHYVFQNRKGGAYRFFTFRKHMLESCAKNQIQNGEYMFQSHDYRHGIATLFYDIGVSIQGIRDYLGHAYEEMTRQYIDFIPKKLAGLNDEYFSRHRSLAANLVKEKETKDGKQDLFERTVKLSESYCGTKKESRKESLL